MGEAGPSPALSRNCSSNGVLERIRKGTDLSRIRVPPNLLSHFVAGARIPSSAGAYTITFAERGWRMKGSHG